MSSYIGSHTWHSHSQHASSMAMNRTKESAKHRMFFIISRRYATESSSIFVRSSLTRKASKTMNEGHQEYTRLSDTQQLHCIDGDVNMLLWILFGVSVGGWEIHYYYY